jgi:ATP-dependent DNA helicase DinG
LWERVESDSDLTLRVRCPHYATCHYYKARREAAGAHLVVVNHALLLADLALRDLGAPGILPRYHRLIIDEAHHLEDAATGAIARRSTLRGLQRATAPLLPRGRRPGGLARLVGQHAAIGSALPPEKWPSLETAAAAAATHLGALRDGARVVLEDLAARALDPHLGPRRVEPSDEGTPFMEEVLAPAVDDLTRLLDDGVGALDGVLRLFDDLPLPANRAQSVLDVRRARRRLLVHAEVARTFLTEEPNTCRWLEPSRGRGVVSAMLVLAPIEVADTLRRLVWERLLGTTVTSATLAVAQTFDHWMRRAGLESAKTALYSSPFDHASQALLGLPRDLPRPDTPRFLEDTALCMREAIEVSGGGAFVLCTSYAAVRFYGDFLRAQLPAGQPVLVQATSGRAALLQRFRSNPNSVLVGTDSFWEGVSVKGVGLRLVVIPRLPFRVPTDPLQKARHEQIERRGGDPFRTYTLPQAVIRLRQGYGRLIRSRTDRGTVLLLDRRIHERSYGRVVLHSLPRARRINGPWRRVREELERFFGSQSD